MPQPREKGASMSWKNVFGQTLSHKRDGSNGVVNSGQILAEPDELLQGHRVRVNALRLESGYQAAQFDRLIGGAITNVAEWVHILPATRAENHSESAGLLRLALETGCLAFRRADGKFLAGPTSTDVHYRERDRVWRYAAFLGGLLRPLGRSTTHLAVVSSDGHKWNALQEALWTWLRRANGRQVEIIWRNGTDGRPASAASVWLASRMIPSATLKYLYDSDDSIPEALLRLVSGERTGRLCEIVEESYQTAIDLDLSRHGDASAIQGGIALEHRLLEALRALCREKWTMNTPGGRLWFTSEGVFLSWRTAANEILVRLKSDGIGGVPRDADTLAEVLLAQGLLVANPNVRSGLKHYFKLLPNLRGAPKLAIDVVKIADPHLLGLQLDGVDRIEALLNGAYVDVPSTTGASPAAAPVPLELPLAAPEEAVAGTGMGEDASSARSEPGPHGEVAERFEPLNRFGPAGQVLKQMAAQLLIEPQSLAVMQVTEGLAVGIPEAIARYCEKPPEFLASCEAQGLLIADKTGGRRFLRTRPNKDSRLPAQYVVLVPRVARHFAFLGGSSP